MKVEVSYRISLPGTPGPLSLWVPVPANTDYQSVLSRYHEGNCAEAGFLSEPAYGAPALYARWEEGPNDKMLNATFVVETRERRMPVAQAGRGSELPADVRHFLEPTMHIPTDGIVKQRAREIVAGRGDPLNKAKAIYDWIIENTHRDFQIAWCGLGDVRTMLESGNLCGKCVDINSLLVALARAAGLPAREVFGIRAAESRLGPTLGRSGDITNAQHCKGEIYLASVGWVPVDPADVVKVTDEKRPAEEIARVRDYFFGAAEGNWVAFNHARDFMLSPAQAGGPLNYFMYPYAERDGKRVEIKTGNPGYTIVSRLLERG
ncbi:MAG: transglutaminase family protein [Chloroflexota bacterium]